jgi:hypothetical protein
MNATPTAADYAETIKREILADVRSGLIPITVTTFEELHDHVDANDYLATAGVPVPADVDGALDLTNDVTDIVHEWLQDNGLTGGHIVAVREITGNTRLAHLIGLRALYLTDSGQTLVGTIERFESPIQPVIRFADGRWAYGSQHLHLIAERA